MKDVLDIISNIDTVYNSNSALAVLKDFERVFNELDIYVFENWIDGELVSGPNIERHWVTCSFMWPREKMPNPEAARKLYEYGCQIKYIKDVLIQPRKIVEPDDIRPNSKKGKLDEHPIWVLEIQMPKKLMLEVFRGYREQLDTLSSEKENPELLTPSAIDTATAEQSQNPMADMSGEINAPM